MLIRLFIATLLLAASPVIAQQPQKKAEKRNAKPLAVTPEREAAVQAFVDQHHPELTEVLNQLKQKKEGRQYERAIRDLYVVSERLTSLKENDEARYELELKAWKVKSRIHLVSARLTMTDNEELENELKTALGQQHDVRREIIQLERNRFRDRVKKAEKDLADHEARRDNMIEKQFQTLTSAGPKARRSRPKPGKESVAKPVKKNAARDTTAEENAADR